MVVEALRDALACLAAGCLPDDPDDLIGPGIAIDETAQLKKGQATACVSPQHAGVTGKVENCVTWVFAALVTASGQASAVPRSTCPSPGRKTRSAAASRLPDRLAFATKPNWPLSS